jgi:polyhydroxybutyrate depolymerase
VAAVLLGAGCSAGDAVPAATTGTASGTASGAANGQTGSGSVAPAGSGNTGVTAGQSSGGALQVPDASVVAPDSTANDAGADRTLMDALVDDSALGDGATPPKPSTGCGKAAPAQMLASYVRHTVSNSNRVYDLYIPTGYNPMRSYPLIFEAHGCDGSIPFHIEAVSKGDAILVALRAAASATAGNGGFGGGCFDTGAYANNVHLAEVPYFDQVLQDVGSMLCVDQARVFIVGYSSGSWLSNLIGCVRAGVVRGQANATGGLPPIPACTGPIAGLLAHDTQDTMNLIDGGMAARDRLIQVNGCTMQSMPYEWDGTPATQMPCVIYQGCKPGYPVIWCQTTGKGHSQQVPITTVGLWRLWSQL